MRADEVLQILAEGDRRGLCRGSARCFVEVLNEFTGPSTDADTARLATLLEAIEAVQEAP